MLPPPVAAADGSNPVDALLAPEDGKVQSQLIITDSVKVDPAPEDGKVQSQLISDKTVAFEQNTALSRVMEQAKREYWEQIDADLVTVDADLVGAAEK